MATVAIIVPFRLQNGQHRDRELRIFLSHMKHKMDHLVKNHKIMKYHIYIINQSPRKKFNRGMLLNIGFLLTKDKYNTFIFHDVDLLPGGDIINWYSMIPKNVVHIANCWRDRYNGDKYLGGIVSFNKETFEKINGYPNTFWGWGGEDDALSYRCHLNQISPTKVVFGTITDIETDHMGNKMNLDQKLIVLRNNPEWKCSDKWEQRYNDKVNWKRNGVKQIGSKYRLEDWIAEGDHTTIYVSI